MSSSRRYSIHLMTNFSIIVLLFFVIPSSIFGEDWNSLPDMEVEHSEAKIKLRGEIKTIPVLHVTQENCIFREAEITPSKNSKTRCLFCGGATRIAPSDKIYQEPYLGSVFQPTWHCLSPVRA